MENTQQLDWHSGFAGGLSLSLRKYRDSIEIEREHYLSKEPLRIDYLLIKKNKDVRIDNSIGRAFRGHNIIEYKNPNDALNIDVVYKCIGYAALYKGLAAKVDDIPEDELTITIFRSGKPEKLFDQLKKKGRKISNPYPGVYSVNGIIDIPLQIIVTKELSDPELIPLEILMADANEDAVRAFLNEKYSIPGDRNDADAVLQISASVNRELYEQLRGDETMCQALQEIMSEEIAEKRREGLREGLREGRREGEKNATNLINFLWENGRGDDAKRAAMDPNYFDQLLVEFKGV